jgi:hypothetical protein
MNWSKLLLLFTCLLTACYKPRKETDMMAYSISETQLRSLGSCFVPFTLEERQQSFAKEYLIGLNFAKELDYYRAITTFKRAKVLAEIEAPLRAPQAEYAVILSYFLANRFRDTIQEFERSDLRRTMQPEFPAYHDLLIILHESYLKLNDPVRAQEALTLLEKKDAKSAKRIEIYDALDSGELKKLNTLTNEQPYGEDLQFFLNQYESKAKSVKKAALMSMVIPGSGYLYAGQTRSFITSFLLNALFIAATVHLFNKGHTAAGIITAGFEAGWYFGSIYGSSRAVKFYNERLYGKQARWLAEEYTFYPSLNLKCAF